MIQRKELEEMTTEELDNLDFTIQCILAKRFEEDKE